MLIKLSTWSLLMIRIKDEVTIRKLVVPPLKGRKSSNIWEKSPKNKILSRKKLRTEEKLKSRNACYHSVKYLLSSSLLSVYIKIKVCRNIILRVVCMGLKIGHSH